MGIYTPDEDDESTDSEFGDLTQQSSVPSTKKSPGFAAKDIDFQDFLRFVEVNSSYSLSTAVNTRPANPRLYVRKLDLIHLETMQRESCNP